MSNVYLKNPVTCRWSLRVCRLEHAGHHVVLRLAVGEGGELTRMLPSWLRSSVYETEDPGFDSRRSCAVFFSPDPAVSFLSSSEQKRMMVTDCIYPTRIE